MLKHFLLASAAASVLFSSPLAAQGRSAPTIGLTPYAGYMKFGNIISGPLGTGLRNAGSAVNGSSSTGASPPATTRSSRPTRA